MQLTLRSQQTAESHLLGHSPHNAMPGVSVLVHNIFMYVSMPVSVSVSLSVSVTVIMTVSGFMCIFVSVPVNV